jgi:hypothetical protein
MQQAMFLAPSIGTQGLVFLFVNQLTVDTSGNVLFWNDTSQNGFNAAVEGVETPTFFSMSGTRSPSDSCVGTKCGIRGRLVVFRWFTL